VTDSYKTALISLISSILLLLAIIIYRYIFPKRKINLLFFLILISLLPLISISGNGSYESGDLNIHAGFAMSFYQSLKDGNFIPRWSSEMIYGYGYPLFLFAYPLPYYLAAFFHFFGFSFVNSLKIILASSFILSGVTMYLFVKEEMKNKFSAFVAGIFYLFSPYHLVDLHFRVAVGETIAFSILPFCFFAIKKMFYNRTFLWFTLSAISFSLLILSHQAISLVSLPFIIVYCLYLWTIKNRKRAKDIFFYFSPLIVSLLLSSFYWLPVIAESKYINLLTQGNISFVKLSQLLYSPWRWGFLFQGPNGELSFIVGYVQWFIVGLSIIFFLKNKIPIRDRTIYLMSIISFFILLVMTQPISSLIWSNILLLRGFQFSYRLLLLIAFFTSIIAAIIIKNSKNKLFCFLLCFIAVSTTILNWGNRKTLPQLNDSLIEYEFPRSMTKVGDSTTIWVDSNRFTSEKRLVQHLVIIRGRANVSDISRNSTRHKYLINVLSEKADVKENTLYFPNWIVKVDNNPYSFSFTDPDYPGVIKFSLNKGSHVVEVIFTNTFVRIFATFLSESTLLGILIYAFVAKKLNSPKP